MSLSERIRDGVEAAPWVIEEVAKLETENQRLLIDLEIAESALDAQRDFRREIERLREVLRKAKPVYATSKNTASVRKGHEVGGYVKHYELPPHVVHAALAGEEVDHE